MKHTDSNPNYVTLGQLQECLQPAERITFHFWDCTLKMYPNLIYTNKNSQVNSVYTGTDNVLHVVVNANYGGDYNKVLE